MSEHSPQDPIDPSEVLHQAETLFDQCRILGMNYVSPSTREPANQAKRPASEMKQEWEQLTQEILNCTKCPLHLTRTHPVPGEGDLDANLVFVGEAPGFHEDQQGKPFVGRAGGLLTRMIAAMGLTREQVYICNIIKCRPPQNRDPLPDEIAACHDWLDRQIALIKPKMIVTLGRFSMARYFPGKSISKIHGTSLVKDGIIYFAMYHPAAALHQQKLRQTIMEDMLKIPPLLKTPGESPPAAEPPSKQLNMFEV